MSAARVVVLGADVEALVAAHLLARAGRQVVVIAPHERDTEPPAALAPAVAQELGLAAHGLRVEPREPWAVAPLEGGGTLELAQDPARSAESIGRVSARDAARWPEFCARMARLARLIETLYAAPAPDPLGRGARGLLALGSLGLRLRRLGREGLEELLRLAPMPLADLLDDWFEADALKGLLAAAALRHSRRGPRAAGTAFALLHRHAGCPAGVFSPPESNLPEVLERLPGVERKRAEPLRLVIRGGKVTAVALGDGELACDAVVSALDPKRTLLGLLGAPRLEPDFVHALAHLRSRGVAARVILTVPRPAGPWVVAPSLDYLERAADAAKYGKVSEAPWLDVRPLDGNRVAAHLQCAPYRLAAGSWDAAQRSALGQLALRLLAERVPEFAGAAIEEVLVPPDLEARFGYPEGQALHAELALDQSFWMRPVPGWARHRTPVGGLYLCGLGTHPAGGLAGASGRSCARELLHGSDPN